MSQREQIDLGHFVTRLMRWSWLIVLTAALSGTLAFVVSGMQEPVYRASTTVLIDEAPSGGSDGDYRSILTSERRTQTYAQLLRTRPLLQAVIGKLGLSISAGSLQDMVSVEAFPETQLIEIRVQDADPERAAQVANTVVTTFAEQLQQLQAARYKASKDSLTTQLTTLESQIQEAEARLSALGDDPTGQATRDQLELALARPRETYSDLLQTFEQIRVAEAQTMSSVVHVEPAEAPGSPWFPPTRLFTTMATILGILLVVGVLYIREVLDTRARNSSVTLTPSTDSAIQKVSEIQAVVV